MDHYLSTRCLFGCVLYYAIIGYTIALCTLSIQRLLIDNIENDINVALVVAHKRHICRSGLKRVNVEKYKFMIFFKQQKIITNFRITINNSTIEQVDHFIFLGLTLDQNIT